MNHRRLIAGVPLLAIALACYPGSPASRAAPKAEGANSITSTNDTAKEGTIKASGEFTTVRGVTLTKVVVWAYPASSGVLPAPAELTERDIDDKKKTWGPAAITTRVYAGRYAVRADGYFSDGTSVSSAYEVKMAGGDVAPEPGLTVEWAGGFPTSPAPRFLNCCGTYQGKPNANKTGQLIAIPLGGGAANDDRAEPEQGGLVRRPAPQASDRRPRLQRDRCGERRRPERRADLLHVLLPDLCAAVSVPRAGRGRGVRGDR